MNKTFYLIFIALTLAMFIAGALLYPQFPDRIASHWNAAGNADGYMNKFWGVFLLPTIMFGLFALYWIIPKIDPLKKNIESFRKQYNLFWFFLSLFLSYIYGLQIAWNLGARFDFSRAIIPALAILFYVIGGVLKNAKRNWFFGIRTPWTLSSDLVWEKTHLLGSKLFKISAFFILLGAFFPELTVWFILVPVFASAFGTLLYSFFEYRRLQK